MSLPLERYKNISGVKKNQGGAESNETGLFSVKHKARKILSGSPAGMQPLSNSLQLLHVATFKTRTSMSSCWASNCYSQTGKTMNTRNISGMSLCCTEKANQV